MVNTDMMIAVSNGQTSTIQDHYSSIHAYPPSDIQLGGTNDLKQLSSGIGEDQFIDITFERKLLTGDKFDQIILIDQEMEIC